MPPRSSRQAFGPVDHLHVQDRRRSFVAVDMNFSRSAWLGLSDRGNFWPRYSNDNYLDNQRSRSELKSANVPFLPEEMKILENDL